MGILIKKKQAGGVFADPRYLVLNAKGQMQQPVGGGVRGQKGNFAKPISGKAKTKSSAADLEGFLPSDIKYYQSELSRIASAMDSGFSANIKFDETPEYEMLLKEKYDLEATKAPQMKSMNKLYEKTSSKFQTNMAGDAPAIVNNVALVRTIDEATKSLKYTAVTVDELLTNPSIYQVLKGQDIIELRKSDPNFSGFTGLGRIADQIISTAYGSKNFEKEIDDHLSRVGYEKFKGKYINIDTKQGLGLDNLKFDPTSNLITKSNYKQLGAAQNALMSDRNHLTEYLSNKSIIFLQNKLASGAIKIDDKNNTLDILKSRSISTQIARKLVSSLIQDEQKNTGTMDKKDKHGNIFSDAGTQLLQNKHRIEIDNINDANPAVGSVMNVLPAAFVQMGGEFFNTGYGEDIKDDESKGVTAGNRKTLKNNAIIQNMKGGQSEMTTYDGTLITDIVDDGDLNYAIIPTNANLHIVLAPTVKNEQGDIVVDFTNEFTPKMMQAIAETYEELKKQNITEADLIKGGEVIEKAQKIAREKLKEILGEGITNAPEIRASFAFNIQYEVDSESSKDPKAGWVVDDSDLHSIIDEPSGWWGADDAKETLAFIPISTSFWTGMFKRGTFDKKFENVISAARYEGALKTTPKIGLLDITGIADYKAYEQYNRKKKFGGKLASTEEIRNLLFN